MSRGLTESVLYNEKKVKERYGLKPGQIIDYKALRGDPSDNIPGGRGIGEKTAVELLQGFSSLEKIYQAVENNDTRIKPRTKELLNTSKADAFLSRELATIDCHAPIQLRLEEARFSAFDDNRVATLFRNLEFRSLLNKLPEISGGKLPPAATTDNKSLVRANYIIENSDTSLTPLINKIKKSGACSLAGAYQGENINEAKLAGLALSAKSGQATFIRVDHPEFLSLATILEDKEIKKIGHDLKTLWRLLRRSGLNIQGLDFDIMIAAYLLTPGERRYDLDSLAFSELNQDPVDSAPHNQEARQLTIGFDGPDQPTLGLAACRNADLSFQLERSLRSRLQEASLIDVLRLIEMPLVPLLAQMEEIGIGLDAKILEKASRRIRKRIDSLTKEIHQLGGREFNISSTKQLQEILFTTLGIPTRGLKKTKTGFSTAEDELYKLEGLHPIIARLQEYRELTKLESTYLSSLPQLKSASDGKIHSRFNQTIAATGRLSSTDPNLQNIPTRTEDGRLIRTAFIAEPGFKLVSLDYSQIELRIAAHLSRDRKMIAAFKSGEDIHTATAAAINGIGPENVTKEMRREAKAINFGILYGQGPHGLSQSAGIGYAEAKQFIDKYFATYPGIKKMIDGFIAEARQQGYAKTLFGRRRPLRELDSDSVVVRRSAERMAINTPIQGTAADLIKIAMIKAAELLTGRENEARLLLQVHDELIFEIKEDKISDYVPQLKRIMETAADLSVPIIVDENFGDNWGELK